MGPACDGPGAQARRRAPTIRAALRPTGSGPAQTLLLSYDGVAVGRAQTRPCHGAKKTNVSFNKTEFRKAYVWSTGRGNGVTGVHRAFSDGPLEGTEEHKNHNSVCDRKLTCLL